MIHKSSPSAPVESRGITTRPGRSLVPLALETASLSPWVLLLALLSLVFIILLVFLRIAFPFYPLLSYQDAFDLLTPLLLIPVYGILFRYSARGAPGLGEEVLFLALAGLWVVGQGIHLAANSVSNLMVATADRGLITLDGNEIFRLVYFYDELLGHTLWHLGLFGLAALLLAREWRRPAGLPTGWPPTIVAGFIYGLILFIITVEGQTVWLGLPFALLVSVFGLLRGRSKLAERPLLAFFLVSCLLALLCYAGWGLYWRGFPGFVDVGLI